MAIRTPYTPLFQDVLDYLNRGSTIRGLPSIAGIFDDYDASKNNRLGIFEEEEETTKPIVPVGIPAAPMNQMRDGADNRTGFGAFGNLDKNDVKYFQDEYGNLVKGYRNVTSGLYQTEDGKNVQGILDEYEYTSTGSLREPPGQISTGIGSYSPDVIGAMTSNNAYRGIALKAAEDTRLEQKLAEERLQREKEKAAELAKREEQRKQIQDLQNKIDQGQYGGGGGGPGSTTQFGKTTTPYGGGPGGLHSGGGGGGSKSSSKNSSQPGGGFNSLGFSDIRLKDNIELIGKSPSNINIYKFNYKNNPTIYQGVMAHEVPWASVRHDNGYMMVDYNKVDVEFKKL